MSEGKETEEKEKTKGEGRKKMNKKGVLGAIGAAGVLVVIAYMVATSPAVEEVGIGVVKYPLPKSDVDCSNCVLVKRGGAVCPCSASGGIPLQSANGMDWENNSMYIVPVDGGHEFWIEKSTMEELQECGEKMSHLSCKQPGVGNSRLSYLFVFEEGGVRRTISESYVIRYWGERKEWVGERKGR